MNCPKCGGGMMIECKEYAITRRPINERDYIDWNDPQYIDSLEVIDNWLRCMKCHLRFCYTVDINGSIRITAIKEVRK